MSTLSLKQHLQLSHSVLVDKFPEIFEMSNEKNLSLFLLNNSILELHYGKKTYMQVVVELNTVGIVMGNFCQY